MNQALRSLKDRFTTEKSDTIRTFLISEGFGFCFILCCVMGYSLDHYDTVFVSVPGVLLGLLVTILFTQPIALGLLLYAMHIKTKATGCSQKRSATERLMQWLAVTLALVVLWLPIYLAYFPAVFSYDAEAQLYQVISGNFSTHHPILHTLIMGMFMKLGYTPAGISTGMAAYALTQLIVLAGLISASFTVPWKKSSVVSLKALITVTLFVGLFPVYGILAISTTKDIIFAGLAAVMFALLISLEDTRLEYLLLAGTVTLSLLFRNNALYALVVLIIILVFFRGRDDKRRNGRIIVTLTASAVLALIVLAGLKQVTRAESGSPREALSIPIQQLARVKNLYGDELDKELADDLNCLIDDEWAWRYDEHLADPIKERISMKEPSKLVKTWIKLGVKYPGAYIDAWLLTTEGAWYVRDTSCNRIYGEGQITGFGYLSTDIRNMPEGFGVTADSKLPGYKSALERLVSDNAFEHIPVVRLIFAPALYFWVMMLFIFKQLVRRDGSKLMATGFLFLYFLTLLLSPAILVRYMLPFMICAPLMMVYRDDNT